MPSAGVDPKNFFKGGVFKPSHKTFILANSGGGGQIRAWSVFPHVLTLSSCFNKIIYFIISRFKKKLKVHFASRNNKAEAKKTTKCLRTNYLWYELVLFSWLKKKVETVLERIVNMLWFLKQACFFKRIIWEIYFE